jgi:hypothetical protein
VFVRVEAITLPQLLTTQDWLRLRFGVALRVLRKASNKLEVVNMELCDHTNSIMLTSWGLVASRQLFLSFVPSLKTDISLVM